MPTIATLVVDVTAKTTGLAKGIDESQSKVKSLGASLMKTGAVLTGALTVPIAIFADKSINAFDAFKKSADRVGFALGQIHQAGDLKDVTAWSQKFSSQTGILEGDVLDLAGKVTVLGQNYLKNLGPAGARKTIDDLTGAIENMAASTGKSASMLTRSLVPAILNQPEKAISTLTKFGVLTRDQGIRLTALGKHGEYAKVRMAELNAITAKYAGAAAATETPQEKMAQAMNSIQITLGKLLIPVVEKIAGWLQSLAHWFENLSPAGKKMIVTIGLIVAAIGPLLMITGALMKLWGPQGIVGVVILLAVLIITHWKQVKAVTLAVFNAIKDFFIMIWNKIKGVIMPIVNIISIVLVGAVKLLWKVWTTEWNLMVGAVKVVWAILKPIWNAISFVFNNVLIPAVKLLWKIWTLEWNAIKAVVIAVWNAIRPIFAVMAAVIKGLIQLFKDIFGWIGKVVGAISHFISGLAKGATQVVGSGLSGLIKGAPKGAGIPPPPGANPIAAMGLSGQSAQLSRLVMGAPTLPRTLRGTTLHVVLEVDGRELARTTRDQMLKLKGSRVTLGLS